MKDTLKADGAILEKSRKIASELYEMLEELAYEAALSEQITEDMILNASFLVELNRTKEFHNKIHEFDNSYTDVLKIRISGPTAPYNFVKMPEK